MDIFTTALTRVFATPIKAEKLKVKALVKDSATAQVSDDINHLENHETYINLYKDKDKKNKDQAKHDDREHSDENSPKDGIKCSVTGVENNNDLPDAKKDDDGDDVHHLDIFV